MPLPVLIALVVGGIAGIAALTWAFGLSAPRRFRSEAEAREAWLREFPRSAVRSVTLCRSGGAALIDSAGGAGIVWPMGVDSTARFLAGARVTRTATGLRMDLPDYTAPVVRLTLNDEEAGAWAAAMGDTG